MLRFVTTPNATCGRCPEWDESRLRPALVRAGCFFPHRCKEHAVFFLASQAHLVCTAATSLLHRASDYMPLTVRLIFFALQGRRKPTCTK